MKKELSLGIGLLFFLLWVLMDGLGCSPLQLSTGFEAPIDTVIQGRKFSFLFEKPKIFGLLHQEFENLLRRPSKADNSNSLIGDIVFLSCCVICFNTSIL